MPVTRPLYDAYDRLADVFPGLRVVTAAPRSGAGWVRADELAAGGEAVDALTARVAEQAVREHGRRPRPDVAATLALHRYTWPACLLFTVPWFLERRVPRLPVGEVSFHRAGGRMTVRPHSFSCLPDDPAAALPGARVVPGEQALRDALLAALTEHLAPVLDGFGPRLRRGAHAQWGMVTDEITEGLWHIGRLAGEERRAVTELSALLPGGTTPYAGGARFRELPASGGPGEAAAPAAVTRDRLTCCLFYTISAADACAACPRTCAAARIGRLVPAA
ncbi:MAG TPA: (2Fe-2S)-binding protein [Streptomyces sp.]